MNKRRLTIEGKHRVIYDEEQVKQRKWAHLGRAATERLKRMTPGERRRWLARQRRRDR